MAHISGSVGYRIEFKDGKSIAISGDTDYCQNIIDLGFEGGPACYSSVPSPMKKRWKDTSPPPWQEELH